jgi:hypothetical protein
LPLLEYACELWDGCTQQEYNKIEQIQHEAARIITGLPKSLLISGVKLFQNLIEEGNNELRYNFNLVNGLL